MKTAAFRHRPAGLAPAKHWLLFAACLFGLPGVAGAQHVDIERHYPCNLFETGKPVALGVTVKGKDTPSVRWKATDFSGEIKAQGVCDVQGQGGKRRANVEIAGLDRGWYKLDVTPAAGEGVDAKGATTTFGVADFVARTAEEAAARGIRFGMRHRNNAFEGLDACIQLGMQWERNLYVNPGGVANSPNPEEWDWDASFASFRKHAVDREILLVNKVELFPAHCYDAERYGPMSEYKDPVGKHPWSKRTVPLEQPYKVWVRELIRRMPPEQKLFEVWNEPWGKYPPEDFAKIMNWTVDAIKEVRPDAWVGPDTGNIGYDILLAAAGGFRDCDLVTIHPYVGHPEKGGIRNKIRLYRKFMREHLGKELPLYATEWGFGTAAGPRLQAAYMVRQALAMYAEDIRAIIPYIMTPNRKEAESGADHYGYVSDEFEPYPAFLAYANCARMIDGSTFRGDLWLGEYVGAMLFERDGVLTAALWTDGDPRKLTFDTASPNVTQVDIMGVEQELPTHGKPLELTLTDTPIYLVGVGAALKEQAKPLDDPAKRWPHQEQEVVRKVPKAARAITVDGVVGDAEWQGALALQLAADKVAPEDASGTAKLVWDEVMLYVAVELVDDDPMHNPGLDTGVFKGDSIELHVSSKPEMRIPETRGQYDYHVVMSPTSGDGKPVNFFPGHGSTVERRLEGERTAYAKTDRGWIAEMALPWANFPGLKPEAGAVAAFEILVNDLDKDNPIGRNKIRPKDSIGSKWHRDAAPWGQLVLQGPASP